MTPETMPPPRNGGSIPALRPPDFLLPEGKKNANVRRRGEPDVYVSWGGQVYGPAGVDDVMAGVRTSYFDQGAVFWFEGRESWSPIAQFSGLFDESQTLLLPTKAKRHAPPAESIRPEWPARSKARGSRRSERRRVRNRQGGKGGRASRGSRKNKRWRLILIAVALLAVAITAGLLYLMGLA